MINAAMSKYKVHPSRTNEKMGNVGIPLGGGETLSEAIARRMIRLFTRGDYKPGDRLPAESELARQFHVGRGAVREALKALSIIGVVRVERGKGSFIRERQEFLVRPISMGLEPEVEPQSLVAARKLIEVEIAALAAERATPQQIEFIESFLHRMEQTIVSEQDDEYLRADVDFHFAIATAAGNPILGQFLTLLRNLMREWILRSLHQPEAAQEAVAHHRKIVDSIRAHEPAKARKAMETHLDEMGKRLLRSNSFPFKSSQE
jgi:GntR family transcriptional regulator, transcriptional repressor for pyruvate dehydrogenase complex